jgi:hypothetical protein
MESYSKAQRKNILIKNYLDEKNLTYVTYDMFTRKKNFDQKMAIYNYFQEILV